MSEETIRELAYQKWLQEGCPSGRDQEHWKEAEAELSEDAKEVRKGMAKKQVLYTVTQKRPRPPTAKAPARKVAAKTSSKKK